MPFYPPTLLYQLGMLLTVIGLSVDAGCDLPKNMQGHWFTKDHGRVTVGRNNMSSKGYCREGRNGFYIFDNRQMDCFQCLNLVLRHRNIIQYRESFCVQQDSFDAVCDLLKTDTLWHTLVKDNSVPEPCPFSDAYHFTYNNNTGGFCTNPTSYVRACASTSKFRFHYRYCPDAAYTHESEWELECYANWSSDDASTTFMYGKFYRDGDSQSQHVYRCFIYQLLGTVVYLAMSGDSTCRGLRSPRDGSLVMELTKDVFGWPRPACNFPSWVSRYMWRDLSGRNTYLSNTESSVINVRYKFSNELRLVRTAFRCLRIAQQSEGPTRFLALSFTSEDCFSKYQCVMFVKKRDGVVEIHQGSHKEYDTDLCTWQDVENATTHLLIPAPATLTTCPFTGLHRMVAAGKPGCEGYIQAGCNESNSLEVIAPCSSQKRVRLDCLKTWGGKKRSFVVASRAGQTTQVANCFSLKKKAQLWQFGTDKSCNIGTTDIFNTAIKYEISPKSEDCIAHKPVSDGLPVDNRQSERAAESDALEEISLPVDGEEEQTNIEEMQQTQQLDQATEKDGQGNSKDALSKESKSQESAQAEVTDDSVDNNDTSGASHSSTPCYLVWTICCMSAMLSSSFSRHTWSCAT